MQPSLGRSRLWVGLGMIAIALPALGLTVTGWDHWDDGELGGLVVILGWVITAFTGLTWLAVWAVTRRWAFRAGVPAAFALGAWCALPGSVLVTVALRRGAWFFGAYLAITVLAARAVAPFAARRAAGVSDP